MNHKPLAIALFCLLLLTSFSALAAGRGGFGLAVLVNDSQRPEYASGGTVYIEAIRGREYTLRLTNPLPYRVAVALSVDGLNTINAKHSDARSASKWVLGPYETLTLAGWQINGSEARKFYFTGERNSYGAWLGQTDNLGTIEAVFFKEKVRYPRPIPQDGWLGRGSGESEERGSRSEAPSPGSSSQPAPESKMKGQSSSGVEAQSPALKDDYAATGIGGKVDHDVEWVDLDLERNPSAVVRIRYEFRPQLVKLGVLPSPRPCPDPLDRREHARGFSGSYCPDPLAGRD